MVLATAVYGGSFDPFGKHHEAVISWLVAESYQKIIVVPSAKHPLKNSLSPFHHRMAMATLGVKDLRTKKTLITVSDIEKTLSSRNNSPLYTYNLLVALKQKHKQPLKFAVGPDVVKEFARWRFVDQIQQEFGFIYLPENPCQDTFRLIRSTEIRQRIKAKDPTWKKYVSPSVGDYITKHKLYQD